MRRLLTVLVLYASLGFAPLSAEVTADAPTGGRVQAIKDRLFKKEVDRRSIRHKRQVETEIMSMLNVSTMDEAKKEIEQLLRGKKAILSAYRTAANSLKSRSLLDRVRAMETMPTAQLFDTDTIRSTNQLLYNGIYKIKLQWFEATTWLNEFCQTVVQQMSNLINLRNTRASYSAIMRGIPDSLPPQPNFKKYSDAELLNQLNKLTVD